MAKAVEEALEWLGSEAGQSAAKDELDAKQASKRVRARARVCVCVAGHCATLPESTQFSMVAMGVSCTH